MKKSLKCFKGFETNNIVIHSIIFLFIINNVYRSDHKFDAVTFRYCALGVSLNKQLFMEQWTVNDVSVSVSYFDNHQI